jgi:alanine racemase
MAIEFTKAQQRAIETEGNVLVSAAAGSGKTAVLVERVITLMTRKENPIAADRLLIVTFTNAAAAEMRLRIESRLDEVCRENPEESSALAAAERACLLEGLSPIGIFTHFAVSDGGDDGDGYTAEQNDAFSRAIDYLESRGINFSVKHCANSAAIYDHPEYGRDMVRAGISLYGVPASSDVRNTADLKCTLTLKSVITNVKTIYPGESVGYGRTFVAEKPMRVATVPIGYADGLFRLGSGGADVFTVSGVGAPVLGRICMDQTMIDVTDIDGVKMGDEVIVFGDGGVFSISDMARACKTIEYEIFCAISRRVPRVYIADGRVVSVRDYILSDKLNEKR